MSNILIIAAMQDRTLRGDFRLALMAAGDANGVVGVKSVSEWCGCGDDEAIRIISDMVLSGWFVRSGDEVSCPYITGMIEPCRDPSPIGYRKKKISKSTRRSVIVRDGGACHYCGSTESLCVDHKTPEALGGPSVMENYVSACRTCNSAKGTKTYEEFIAWIAK